MDITYPAIHEQRNENSLLVLVYLYVWRPLHPRCCSSQPHHLSLACFRRSRYVSSLFNHISSGSRDHRSCSSRCRVAHHVIIQHTPDRAAHISPYRGDALSRFPNGGQDVILRSVRFSPKWSYRLGLPFFPSPSPSAAVLFFAEFVVVLSSPSDSALYRIA